MASLYVRKSRKGDWDQVTDETPENLEFPANILADILDNENEISVWEVSDPPTQEELDAIVAALHPRGIGNLSDVTLRVISGWKVKGLNLAMRKTKGESLDSKLNNAGKHWVIQINTVGMPLSWLKPSRVESRSSTGSLRSCRHLLLRWPPVASPPTQFRPD